MDATTTTAYYRLPSPAALRSAGSASGPLGRLWFMQAMIQLDGEGINKMKEAFLFLAVIAGRLEMPRRPLCKACAYPGVFCCARGKGVP